MKWSNVQLIFLRELRDQLRDRRTLFTVAVMPMLLYPLMGMAMLQVSQFMQQHVTQTWLIGTQHVPQAPALLVDHQFNSKFLNAGDASLVTVRQLDPAVVEFQDLLRRYQEVSKWENGEQLANQLIQTELNRRHVDVAVYFSSPIEAPQFKNRESNERPPGVAVESLAKPETSGQIQPAPGEVFIFLNSASDQSQIGCERVQSILQRWHSAFLAEALIENDLPASLIAGLPVSRADLALKSGKQAALWSKILPLIIVIWALTGAFYPAIDLCAGEKERGTFETLLSSPAARSEIAIGKLLTVMSFSAATSLLNLMSMAFTGMFVVAKLGSTMSTGGFPLGLPPISGFLWLIVALIPISALFSAVALAAAAFARSSKEGQYYLVPLMMISMPLMMVPMLPDAQLDLGTSLIPISGLMLLLRGLIDGHYGQCVQFAGPVAAVTMTCCWVAIRWVIHQFNSETVLFRASERFSVSAWLKLVMRERHELPSLGNAFICGFVILVSKFFLGFVAHTPESFADFAFQTVIMLVASVGVPACMMALVLTRSARKSLRLNRCTVPMACAAVLLAVLLNPLSTWLTALVMHIYPPGANLMVLESAITAILQDAPNIWCILLIFAVAPAIIEELAFRGFILSGMESLKNKWQAIIFCSLFFGIAHTVIQQSIITFCIGMVLGVIAVQTRSIIPCMLFHAVHNGLSVLLSQANASVIEPSPILSAILVSTDGIHYQYSVVAGVVMTCLGLLVLGWFLRLTDWRVEESASESHSSLPAVT